MKRKIFVVGAVFWGIVAAAILGVFVLMLTGVMEMPVMFTSGTSELLREETYSVTDLEKMTIRGRSEDLRVSLVEGDSITIRHFGDADNQQAFTDAWVSVEGGRGLVIEVPAFSWSCRWAWGRAEDYFEVEIPSRYANDLDLSTTSGVIRFSGDLSCRSIRMFTVSGNINIGTMTLEGRADLGTTSGDIAAVSLSAGSFDAGSVSGQISFQSRLSGSGDLHTVSGDISAAGMDVTGPVTARTISGNVRIVLAGGQNCELRLSSVSGDLGGNVPLRYIGAKKEAGGTVGAGGPLLSASTTSGDIRIDE